MANWIKLAVLAAVSVSALGLPRPDEYDIPDVGNNRRSQYYVLHDDGSFKYGYDTGDNAFESQKTNSDGEVDGQYGYIDEDGQEIRVQYRSGASGFVAQGDHIPRVHPDVTAAFAAARSQGPFVDPLAGQGGDRSYNFNFEGDDHSRNEVSDSDGTVRGSYSYVDEFGRTRNYNYRAGKGIGFVIEGDDIPQQVQPLPTHATSTQFGSQRVASNHHSTQRRTGSQAATLPNSFTHGSANRVSSVRASSSQHSGARSQSVKPAQTYFAPTQSSHSHSNAGTRTSSFNKAGQSSQSTSFGGASHSAQSTFSAAARPATTRQFSRTSGTTRNFEAANTRSSQSPSGSYSFAYETSSHARQEVGDDDNNVRGQFSFVSDDDGVNRAINYEASSATGFIATGAHLPIGPIVPGAPTGQVTGRIVPVVQTPFIDPLARGDLDASFDFGFESDDYSRSEVADEDGNVSGTYSVLGEDNILRTYQYRAGKGIGFEIEEISARPGSRSSVSSSTRSGASHGAASHSGAARAGAGSGGSSQRAGFSISTTHGASSSASHRAVQPVATTYNFPQQSHSSRASAQSSAFSSASSTRQTSRSNNNRPSFKSSSFSQGSEVFPGFSLRQYDASEGRGKYGYVLKFDD